MFSTDQVDALREVVNVGMGLAGRGLAELFDVFVELSVPRVALVGSTDPSVDEFARLRSGGDLTAVRQSFFEDLRGESVVLYPRKGCRELADLLGHEGELSNEAEEEVLLEVGNILVGACLGQVAEQLSLRISYEPPAVLGQAISFDKVLVGAQANWTHALVIQIAFQIEEKDFSCHLLWFVAGEAVETLQRGVDALLETPD